MDQENNLNQNNSNKESLESLNKQITTFSLILSIFLIGLTIFSFYPNFFSLPFRQLSTETETKLAPGTGRIQITKEELEDQDLSNIFSSSDKLASISNALKTNILQISLQWAFRCVSTANITTQNTKNNPVKIPVRYGCDEFTLPSLPLSVQSDSLSAGDNNGDFEKPDFKGSIILGSYLKGKDGKNYGLSSIKRSDLISENGETYYNFWFEDPSTSGNQVASGSTSLTVTYKATDLPYFIFKEFKKTKTAKEMNLYGDAMYISKDTNPLVNISFYAPSNLYKAGAKKIRAVIYDKNYNKVYDEYKDLVNIPNLNGLDCLKYLYTFQWQPSNISIGDNYDIMICPLDNDNNPLLSPNDKLTSECLGYTIFVTE
ncbi:MAG: hypothetical protein PHO28_02475 [Candidatus Pacebacteria bacterium]|nr:hypothetical protein [Candidatus Paceibacterota bacterium]